MIAKVTSVVLTGYDGTLVEVESDAKQGLPGIHIVGMGNKAVDEARERVRSAITHSLLPFPSQKLVINLAPAELPKDGVHFDLPIALSILVAGGQLKQPEVSGAVFAGELSLDGSLRLVRGAISIAEAARAAGLDTVYLPEANAAQAALVSGINVIGVPSLMALYRHLKGAKALPRIPPESLSAAAYQGPTLDDIRGHALPIRALAIAAAGRHNLLMSGPPGTGKTLLAKTLPSLLPPLSTEEQLSVTKLHSLAGLTDTVVTTRPFRAPHHSSSRLALLGGGNKPRPGEVSLAHLGVLFLDELPEYPRTVLEALRQPLEDKQIAITRALGRLTYPADFVLVATMNPCPCGYSGSSVRGCTCSPLAIQNYGKRLSGPLLDRIDLQLTVENKQNDSTHFLHKSLNKNQHLPVLEHISYALTLQNRRYKSSELYNGSINSSLLLQRLALTPAARRLMTDAAQKLKLSTRACLKTLRVARTIADLGQSSALEPAHVAEALQFRTGGPS
jgi:magnesium chelatase family protein